MRPGAVSFEDRALSTGPARPIYRIADVLLGNIQPFNPGLHAPQSVRANRHEDYPPFLYAHFEAFNGTEAFDDFLRQPELSLCIFSRDHSDCS